LFLILHRIVVFAYLYLLAAGYVSAGIDYYSFLAWDYITLIFTLILGAWYGIWLGLYWYSKVYEEQSHGGFVQHLSQKYFPAQIKPKYLSSQMSQIKARLQTDLLELEDLAKDTSTVTQKPVAIKRRVLRKRAPKKLNGLK
jgi:hypothetical protein